MNSTDLGGWFHSSTRRDRHDGGAHGNTDMVSLGGGTYFSFISNIIARTHPQIACNFLLYRVCTGCHLVSSPE